MPELSSVNRLNLSTRGRLVLVILLAGLFALPVYMQAAERAPGPGAGEPGPGTGTGDEDEIDPDNLVLVGERNDEVAEEIEAARMEVVLGHFDRAIGIFQQVIEKADNEYKNSFVLVGRGADSVYVPAREFALREILQLPREARTLYQELFRPRAAYMLKEALVADSIKGIERTAGNYILTSAGKEAASILVEMHSARGDHYRALYFLDLITTFYPEERDAALLARRVLCYIQMSDLPSADMARTKIPVPLLETYIFFMGERVKLGAFLKARVERAKDNVDHSEAVFNSFYHSVMKSGDVPSIDLLSPATMDGDGYWEHTMEIRSSASSPSRRRGRRGYGPAPQPTTCTRFPVIAGRRLLYKSSERIAALDLPTGKLTWVMPNFESTRGYDMYGRRTTTTGSLFALEYRDNKVYFIGSRKSSSSEKTLYAVDLKRGKERILWSCTPGINPGLGNCSFSSVPLTRGSLVFVTAIERIPTQAMGRRGSGTKELRFLACAIDANTGRLRWRTELCKMPGPGMYRRYYGRENTSVAAMTEVDGNLYVCSNTGVLAKISAHTGSVKWIKKYPRPKRKGGRGFGRGQPIQTSWSVIPPIFYRTPPDVRPVREVVIIAPIDSNECLGVDPTSGRLVFKVGNEPPGNRYLIGPWKDLLLMYGSPYVMPGEPNRTEKRTGIGTGKEHLFAYDILSGRSVMHPLQYNGRAVGKGIVAGDNLYIPCEKRVMHFSLKLKVDETAPFGKQKKLAATQENWQFWPRMSGSSKSTFGTIYFYGKQIVVSGTKMIRSFAPSEEDPEDKKPDTLYPEWK